MRIQILTETTRISIRMAATAQVTTNVAGNPKLAGVYNVKTVDDCRALYDEWADTFEQDVTGPTQGYVAPALVAQAILAANGNINGSILDAGCGTGLSGIPLAQCGAKTIDGIDLSPGMLKIARRSGIYRYLDPQDLSKPMSQSADTYDIVTCVGTLTHGHVGPVPALEEFVRISKPGGLVAATVLDDIWESHGYRAEVERLEKANLVEVVSKESAAYRKAAGVNARILVMRKR